MQFLSIIVALGVFETSLSQDCPWTWSGDCGDFDNYVGEGGDCVADASDIGGTDGCPRRATSICDGQQINDSKCVSDCVQFHLNCCCYTDPPTLKPTESLVPTINPVSSYESMLSSAPTKTPITLSGSLAPSDAIVNTTDSDGCPWEWTIRSQCSDFDNYIGQGGDCVADASGIGGILGCSARATTICDGRNLSDETCTTECVQFHRNCCCPPETKPSLVPMNSPTAAPQLLMPPTTSDESNAPFSEECDWDRWTLGSECSDFDNFIGEGGDCVGDASGIGGCFLRATDICNGQNISDQTCSTNCISFHRGCCCPPEHSPSSIPTKSPTPTIFATLTPTVSPTVSLSENSGDCPWNQTTSRKCGDYNNYVGGDCIADVSKGKNQGTIYLTCYGGASDYCSNLTLGASCAADCTQFHKNCCCPPQTYIPTKSPTEMPFTNPTGMPSTNPTVTKYPSNNPSLVPTQSLSPSLSPTQLNSNASLGDFSLLNKPVALKNGVSTGAIITGVAFGLTAFASIIVFFIFSRRQLSSGESSNKGSAQ